MKIRNISILVTLGLLVAMGTAAFAQAVPLPTDPDGAGIFTQILAALGKGQYLVLALLSVAGLVWAAEHYGAKLFPALSQPIPSALIALGMSLIIPVVNLAVSGTVSLTEILSALGAGFLAWGGPLKLIALFTGQTVSAVAVKVETPKPKA